MNTNKQDPSSGSNGQGTARTKSESRSAGPEKPASDGKESFDEAVTEHIAQEKEGGGEEAKNDSADGNRDNQPALQEQDNEGNPAKADNE